MLPLTSVLALALLAPPSGGDELSAALDRISPQSLRGHLAFLASDLLEGRGTPSRGLDLAALYIATQFERSGLEPSGDDGYFQTAQWTLRRRDGNGFQGSLEGGDEPLAITPADISVEVDRDVHVAGVPVVKLDFAHGVDREVRDRVIVTEMPRMGARRDREQRQKTSAFLRDATSAGAVLVLVIDRDGKPSGFARAQIVGSSGERPRRQRGEGPAVVRLHGARFGAWYDALGDGTASLDLGTEGEEPVKVRNVVGRLPGSDPKLAGTCVVVSAHYDHLGIVEGGEGGDRIYNGANDDGSGTVSVLELAQSLAAMSPRPKRSILFVTFFGEEMGCLGSRHYVEHPVVPLASTVADVNLEQLGRTDDSEGPTPGIIMMTGDDYSGAATMLMKAGAEHDVQFRHHPLNSDRYFGASDNIAFAAAGVPAHTLCTSFVYPDYHGLGDHWDKIDYENLARVDRAVLAGVVAIANAEQAPGWTESDKTEKYREAWRKLHEQ